MSDSVPKSPNQSSGAFSIPAKIGRYEILDKVGSGRTGTVYRATDPFIGRFLAIKTFRVDLAPGPQRDRFLQRFYHEARISGGLAHPNIVTLFDVGELDGLPYLVFEHVEGPTLDVAIARVGRLDSVETIRIVEQLASALDFAHAHGVVHRDIRPANIILGADKRVRVADFGIARLEGSQLTQLGEILGTPAYMSPEQIRGYELTPESDLFALAICAYEMLSGSRPFVGKTQAELLDAIVYSPPNEPKELRTLGIPSRDFMFVFERALAKDPAHRFADGASFARALKSCLGMVVSDEEPPLVAKIAAPDFKPKPASTPAPAPPPLVTPASRLIGVVPPPPIETYKPTLPKVAGPGSSAGTAETSALEHGPSGPRAVSVADETMLGSEPDGDEVPPTIRLSRASMSSNASKAESAAVATDTPRKLSDTQDAPLTAVLGSTPTTSASAANAEAIARSEDKTIVMAPSDRPAALKPVDARPAEAVSKSEDKTMVMAESERAAVAKMMPGRGSEAPSKSEDKTMVMPEAERAAVAKMMPGRGGESPAKSEDKTMVMPETERAAVARQGALGAPEADTSGRSESGADRTVLMTSTEKAAAARMKMPDRSQKTSPPPTLPQARPAIASTQPAMKTGSVPRPASLPAYPPAPTTPMKTGGIPRPQGQSSAFQAPASVMVARPSMAPKIIVGAIVMVALLALAVGGVLLSRAGGGSGSASSEKWNDLPVYPESVVTKSPLVYSQELPKPKMEVGRVVSVTVSWIVTPEGRVDDPKIIQSASKEIDEMMLEAVKKWRYEPAEKDGKTVPVRVLRKYTFGQRASSEGS